MDDGREKAARYTLRQVFGKNSLHSILRNPKYTGLMVFNRSASKDVDGKRNSHAYKDESEIIKVPDAVPPIISQEDFDKVQEKLKNRMQTRKHSHAKENYLLTGKMSCGVCGGAYVGARRKKGKSDYIWTAYGCNRRFRTKNICCTNKELSKKAIESFILNKLSEYVFSDNYISRITAEYNNWLQAQNGENVVLMKMYKSRLKTLESDIESAATLLIQIRSEALMNKLQALEQQKVELQAKLDKQCQANLVTEVTENEIRQVFLEIRNLLTSGKCIRRLK